MKTVLFGLAMGAVLLVGLDCAGRPNTCEEKAVLHYAMADSVGAIADAAYEDTFAACEAERAITVTLPEIRIIGSL